MDEFKPLPRAQLHVVPRLRGIHSFTFQLNVSALFRIGGVFRGYSGDDYEGSRGAEGWLWCDFASETAQVELRRGRV